jgi:hypothetical protein
MKFFDVSPNIIMLCLPGLLALPVALFAPLDVLENNNLDMFVKFVEIFVPMIKKIDPFLDTWQVAKLYYSVVWSCIPFSTMFLLNKFYEKKEKILASRKRGVSKRIFSIFLIGMMVVFLWTVGFSDHELGRQVFITYSRFGMATLGSIFMMFQAFFIALLLFNILNFRNPTDGDSNGR